MKYIVKKEIPGAKVGDIIGTNDNYSSTVIWNKDMKQVLDAGVLPIALDQGFIEPYEEKPKRWRAEYEGEYFQVTTQNYDADNTIAVNSAHDHHEVGTGINFLNTGNYFKSQETATAVAEALRLFFEWLHTPYSEESDNPVRSIRNFDYYEITEPMDEARRKVLADNEVSE